MIAILRVTSLRKRFVLKIEMSSSNLFANNLIDDLIINKLTKFASFRLRDSYVNSSTCRKLAKARQKTTCNVAPNRLAISKMTKTSNRMSRMIVLRSRETSSL
jgi:hypothetical protein